MKGSSFGTENTYTIYKYMGGKKVILAHFHNLFTKRGKETIAGDYGFSVHSVWFGTGSTAPSESDTALTSPLWTFSSSNIISWEPPTIDSENVWNCYFTARVEASSSYVGTVSEVGIYIFSSTNSRILATHALIKDAEGNPMTITKTDAEELLVDVHIQFRLSSTAGLTWNKWYYYVLGGNSSSGSTVEPRLPAFNNLRVAMLRSEPDVMSNGVILGSVVNLTKSYNSSTGVLTCTGGRFVASNLTSQEYINAIGIIPCYWYRSNAYINLSITPIGYLKFPNTAIFPYVTLSDMRVGTGDGSTTEFTPPLNLWVENTEQIYVDGVLQVRGVDYTADHRNNLSKLKSLVPSNFSKLRGNVKRADAVSTYYGSNPLKGGYHLANTASNTYTWISLGWDKDNPLEWELEEDPQIGMEADGFYFSNLYNSENASWTGAVLTLSYSTNAEDWTVAGVYTVRSGGNYLPTYDMAFASTITAKYWRLSVDPSAGSASLQKASYYASTSSGPALYLYRNGEPIKFTNAPASGAVITMNAQIDRPMKNNNFIIDFNPTFQL